MTEINPDDWPVITDQRPLYVNQVVDDYTAGALAEKGWLVKDIRTLSSTNMVERQTVVLAWLEGVRQGTIIPKRQTLDFLELEAQITGLKTGKTQEPPKKVEKTTIESLLDFNSHRVRDSISTPKK